MAKVMFHGGPYDGKECDLPFTPDLLIGETMDGDWGNQGGSFVADLRISRYVYQLALPHGEDEPFEYRYRLDRPRNLDDWIREPPRMGD